MEKDLLRSRQAKRVTLVGFWINAVLTIFKLIGGIVGHSGAMIADAIHSLSDFLTDIVVLVGFKMTEKPEDADHNYGHDKFETFATLIIAVFLFIVGFEILSTGISNILIVVKGGTLDKPGMIALIAAITSIISKELLYQYTARVGKKINAPAVIANGWHHRSDAFSSIGTAIGIGGAIILGSDWTILDPLASVIVSIFIFKVSVQILVPAANELMEKALTKDEIEKINKIISANTEITAYHELRTRRIGTKCAIEFHIQVNQKMDITNAHRIATDIENQLTEGFGEASIITIHIEPDNDENLVR